MSLASAFIVPEHPQGDAFKTLLANATVNRMKIMQQPDLADKDAMPIA
jgi:hypothetical protein